jgi:hypothetical protein
MHRLLLKPDELPPECSRGRPLAHALFAPGDRAPTFIPGLKVEVFHGLNEDKRGDPIPERGLFDLWRRRALTDACCSPWRSSALFQVRKPAGWLQLSNTSHKPDRPQILLASPARPASLYRNCPLSQSPAAADHPAPEDGAGCALQAWTAQLQFHSTDKVIELLHRADVMVSDNSSILQEFLLLGKPVISYRNRNPGPFLINIHEPEQLHDAIARALHPDAALRSAIAAYGSAITPWRDGRSANRIMDAVEEILANSWQDKKPMNLLRNLKMRRQLNYYRFW